MRSIYAACLGLLLLAAIGRGQPTISYVIPDIGAEGLNTYVEIIGPADNPGNFGADGLYLNLPGDAVRVEPGSTDAGKILVGPVVVSWNGRLISTQIFVKPGVKYRGPVSLAVTVNGQSVTDRSFTIVDPQNLGTNGVLSGGGALGSGGQLGLRSPRGAMIVDSLILRGGNFTVSTNDPDGNAANGNQGYLPFILISRGPIVIDGSTVLHVNANGSNGAAGGGGGGGDVCNGSAGSTGGSGYTVGGAGGRRSGAYAADGESSGPAGGSLNGAGGGGDGRPTCTDPTSAGGGTGHPFGSGGSGYCAGNVTPGNGGAAGNAPGGGGGGGGYTDNGKDGSASTFITGGRAHGNIEGVPVAGGSGGAGGNSTNSNECGGGGGGGGGAIVLYSMERLDNQFRINAAGANGVAGSGAGGGSGGYVAVGAKTIESDAGRLFALGGFASGNGGDGSPGRLRFDGFPFDGATGSTGSSLYAGPSIDSLSYVDARLVTITGSGNSSDSLRLYYRRDDTDWMLAPAVTYTPGSRRWSVIIDLPPVEGDYYFCAAQKGGGATSPGAVPDWVLSQAAANVVTLKIIPKMSVPDSLHVADLQCETERTERLVVKNVGDAVLTITPSLSGSPDFTLLAPNNSPFSIPARDSVALSVRFVPSGSGTSTASLRLQTNDPRTLAGVAQADRSIPLTGRKLLIDPQFVPSRIDLGAICLGSSLDTILQFRYQGDVDGMVASTDGLNAPFVLIEPNSATIPRNLGLSNNVQVRIRFSPTDIGIFYDTLEFRINPCDSLVRLPIKALGVSPRVDVNPGSLAYGEVPLSASAPIRVSLVNRDTIPVTITNVRIDPPNADFSIDPGLIGRTLLPGQSIEGDVIWKPTSVGALRPSRMCVTLGGVCQAEKCRDVFGTAVRSRLQVYPSRLVLTADSCLDDPIEDVPGRIILKNNGSAVETVTGVSSGASDLTIIPSTPLDSGVVVAPGDSMAFDVVWAPSAHGVVIDRITIRTASSDAGGDPVIMPVELRREYSAIAILDTTGAALPRELEFAPDFQCMGPQIRALSLQNLGTLDEVVTMQFAQRTAFAVNPVTPVTLPAGATPSRLTIRFDPGAPGVYFDTLIATLRHCDNQVRIPVRGERFELAFSVGAVNFGPSRVGSISIKTAALNNTSTGPNNARLKISQAYIKQSGTPFSVVGTNLPTELAPGEVAAVDVAFNPPAQGAYTAELCYVIDAPCPQEICLPLRGTGSLANMIVRQRSLNYGPRLFCEDSTLDVVVENTGTSAYMIRDIRLEGADAVAFQQGSSLTYPYSLGAGMSVTIPYRFIPSRAMHDGLNTATLVVVTEDPLDTAITIDLMGERRRQLRPTPIVLDFGLVEVTTTVEKTVVLSNRTGRAVTVDRLTIDPPFEIVWPTGTTVIPAWDSLVVRVRISPSDTASQLSELIAWQSTPCPDTTVVITRAQGGIIAVGVASISLAADVTAKPGASVSIPIVVDGGKDLNAAQARSFKGVIRVNRKALLLTGARARWELDTTISSLGITASSYAISTDGESRLINVEMMNPGTPNVGDTLGFIDAVALLGDSLSTRLIIDTLYWTDGKVRVTRRNGLFTLDGICTVGGNRLVEVSGQFGIKMAAPNPFNPTTDIVFETVSDEPTWLLIYDARGNVVSRLINGEQMTRQPHARRWDATGAPSGLYYAVLVTPARRSIQPLLLSK